MPERECVGGRGIRGWVMEAVESPGSFWGGGGVGRGQGPLACIQGQKEREPVKEEIVSPLLPSV